MKTGIKELHIIVFLTVISIFFTGCQSKEEQKTAEEPVEPAISAEEAENAEYTDAQEDIDEEDGFILYDSEEIFIPFTECVCEYDNGDLQIYTKYIEERSYYSEGCTVIYMKTTDDNMKITTHDEYCIDYENGEVYCVEREEYGEFISIYKYFAGSSDDGYRKVERNQIVNVDIVEEWLAETFDLVLRDAGESFTDRRVYVTALEYEKGIPVLKGEASGIHIDTDAYCHVEWEINTATEQEEVIPHEKKIYDEEKDKEIFEACDKAFTEKDGGNLLELSDLKDWNDSIDWDSIQGYKEVDFWLREDLNGDNLPELIGVSGTEWFSILRIDIIYTYVGAVMKPIDRVYWDPNDMTEFIYFGSTGNLIYENCDSGLLEQGRFTWYQFDDAWRRKFVLRLTFDYFWEETEYSDKEEKEALKERYPDTYGSRGAGYYCYKSLPKTADGNEAELIKEEITLDEFLKEYEQITGFDFFEMYPEYDHIHEDDIYR